MEIKYLLQRIANSCIWKRNTIKQLITTPISRLKLLIMGGGIGKNCKFYGVPIVHLQPGSSLTIGSNCTFRSGKKDNYIGLATPCIISALSNNAQISIGNKCGFSGAVIGARKSITIGNSVKVGANCVITDTDWHPEDPRSGSDKPVIIGDNVWLGYGTIVLKGVTIGKNTVIGAGSVVTKSIPANVVAAGNPCKPIKAIRETDSL